MSDNDLGIQPIAPADLLSQATMLPAAPAGRIGPRKTLEQTAHDFESVLLHKVFEEMRRTVPESGLLEDGVSEQVQGMFWFYLAQDVGNKGGLGLWRELARQMGRMVERQEGGANPAEKVPGLLPGPYASAGVPREDEP